MDILLRPLFRLIDVVLDLYIWIVIFAAILSLLVAFNVVNTGNRLVYMIGDFLHRATEPALAPIRRRLPSLGGIDVSPVVLILGIWFLREVLHGLARVLGV